MCANVCEFICMYIAKMEGKYYKFHTLHFFDRYLQKKERLTKT